MLVILQILTPIFLIIGLGWLLARSGFLSAQSLADLNRLTYWVGLPSLLFHKVAAASPEIGAVADLLLVGIGATLLTVAAAALACRVAGIAPAARGTFIQASFRGNLAYIGLPVLVYAFAGSGVSDATMLVAFGPMVVIYNILAVLVLLFSGGQRHQRVLGSALRGLLTNPILLACLAGLAVALVDIELPLAADRTLAAIGQMALPLALICIGGSLWQTRLQGSLGPALGASLIKVALLPAIGVALAAWVGLGSDETRIVLIMLACPTASASYVLVHQLKGDTALATSAIVISNLLSLPAMVIVLAIT